MGSLLADDMRSALAAEGYVVVAGTDPADAVVSLEFVELGGTLEKFPSELSGGMRRRAAIARAVVTEPPLVLYDSPTAGLDPITAHTIIALLIKERDVKQTTTLLVTQRYQDGNLIANFRYNSKQGRLEPARKRAYEFLMRRGYASAIVYQVVREWSAGSAD